MSGSLKVEVGAGEVRLRVRHHPFWVGVWCYGLMGGLAYAVGARFGFDDGFARLFAWGGAGMATLFVGMAWLMDRRLPILRWVVGSQDLEAPRAGVKVAMSDRPCVGYRNVTWTQNQQTWNGQAIYVSASRLKDAVPVYVDRVPGRAKERLEVFAREMSAELFQLPSETLEF